MVWCSRRGPRCAWIKSRPETAVETAVAALLGQGAATAGDLRVIPMTSIACKNCGKVLYSGDGPFPRDLSGEDATPRKPCPDCGSTIRSYSVSLFANLATSAALNIQRVQRAWNNNQLAILLFLLSVAVAVGVAVGLQCHSATLGVGSAIGSLALFAALLWALLRGPLAHIAVDVIHRISGF